MPTASPTRANAVQSTQRGVVETTVMNLAQFAAMVAHTRVEPECHAVVDAVVMWEVPVVKARDVAP